LLAVVVIIAVLAGLALATAKYATHRANVTKARAEIAALENAIESYKSDTGMYPTSFVARYKANIAGSNWNQDGAAFSNSWTLYQQLAGGSKVYFQFKPEQVRQLFGMTYIVDPWGRAYNYYTYCCPNPPTQKVNQATFDLWSYGPDGASVINLTDTRNRDDITNYR
jgi:general secretion pathway protein G